MKKKPGICLLQTEANRQLAIMEKESLQDTFTKHLVINKPIQTKLHTGDNHFRVGCLVLKINDLYDAFVCE